MSDIAECFHCGEWRGPDPEIDRLRTSNAELLAALTSALLEAHKENQRLLDRQLDPDFIDDLREFLKDREDADVPEPGVGYVPNDAMKLLMRLNELFPEEGN